MRSIALPSHRNYEDSQRAIESAVRYGCHLSVADNSGDPEKLTVLGYGTYKQTPKDCPHVENFLHAYKGTQGDWVLQMGDDDVIVALCESAVQPKPDTIGISICMQGYLPETGIAKITQCVIDADAAIDRIRQYFAMAQGSNLASQSFWRRDVMDSMMDVLSHHPTQGGYLDWAFMFGLVSSGKIQFDASTVYFKDLSNWAGDQAAIDAESQRLYTACGYGHMARHDALLKSIDSYIFINRRNSPVPAAERFYAAQYCLNGFTMEAIMEVLEMNGLGEKYREWHRYAVGREWGE